MVACQYISSISCEFKFYIQITDSTYMVACQYDYGLTRMGAIRILSKSWNIMCALYVFVLMLMRIMVLLCAALVDSSKEK